MSNDKVIAYRAAIVRDNVPLYMARSETNGRYYYLTRQKTIAEVFLTVELLIEAFEDFSIYKKSSLEGLYIIKDII